MSHSFLAIFQIHRIEDAPPAVELKPSFHHLRIGAVEHNGRFHLSDEALDHFVHIGRAGSPNEIDAYIEHVRAILHLILGHRDQAVPVVLLEQPLELARAVGVGALGDDEITRILTKIFGGEETGNLRLDDRRAFFRLAKSHSVDQRCKMIRPRAAAAADDVHAVIVDESHHPPGEIGGREREECLAILVAQRQTGVG